MCKKIEYIIYKDDGNNISKIYQRGLYGNSEVQHYLNRLGRHSPHLLSIRFNRNPHTGLITQITVYVKSSFQLKTFIKETLTPGQLQALNTGLIYYCLTDRDRRTFTIISNRLKRGHSLYIQNKPQVKEHDLFRASLPKPKYRKTYGKLQAPKKASKDKITVIVKRANEVIKYEL